MRWVFKVPREAGVVKARRDFVSLARSKGPWAGSKVRPSLVELHMGPSKPLLSFSWIPGFEAALLLALAEMGSQVIRNPLAQRAVCTNRAALSS